MPRSGGPAVLLADSLGITFPSVAWLGSDTVVYAYRGRGGVSVVAKDGGTPRTIVPEDAAGSTLRNFAGLPGGQAMLAIRCSTACLTTALVVVDLRTGTTKPLAEDALAAWWLSDGIVAYARRDDETGQFEVYVRPYPDVNSGRWPVSQAGGLQPVWSRNGRELFYQNGAKMLVSAAVLSGRPSRWGRRRRYSARAHSHRATLRSTTTCRPMDSGFYSCVCRRRRRRIVGSSSCRLRTGEPRCGRGWRGRCRETGDMVRRRLTPPLLPSTFGW